MKIVSYAALLFVSFVVFSCKDDEPQIKPEENFLKIYNDESFQNTFIPIDIVQSADSSFFILGSYDYIKTYVLKVDKLGNFMWDFKLDENMVNPIPGLFEINNTYYFFCMDEISLATYLVEVSDSSSAPSIVNTYGNIIYPLHASRVSENELLLLSYDRDAIASRLTKLDENFATTFSTTEGFAVLEDAEPDIIGHVFRTGERLPFFTGASQGGYFFNGFSNFSFSLHFTNQGGNMTGVINGFRDEGIITAALNISGNSYAVARNSHTQNFILPQTSLSENGTSINSDLGGNDHPEIAIKSFVKAEKIDVIGQETIVVGATTKSGQVILYFYGTDGALKGSKRMGFNNPYELVKFVQTSDGGLAVLGNTYVAGRFSRICLFRIPKQELIDIVF